MMEKESFHNMSNNRSTTQVKTTAPEETETLSEIVSNLPVPSQLPEPTDLSHLPIEILRSSTVETLIHQNEDLLSRLSISLRRNSRLEEEVSQLEKNNRILSHQHENLKDQIYVFKKKDELIEGKYSKYEQKIADYKKDLKLFEVQYTELYSTTQSKISELKSKLAQASKKIGRFSRFKTRAFRIYKAIKKNKEQIATELQSMSKENTILKETQFQMKQNFAASIERLQVIEKENNSKLAELTSNYETQIEDINKAFLAAQRETRLLASELEKSETVYEKNIELENQLLHLQRKMDEFKTESAQQIHELSENVKESRIFGKSKVLEVEQLNTEIIDSKSTILKLKDENLKLSEQVESIQALWRDNNLKLESAQQRYESLQKLNQQISITLNETRKLLKSERDSKETLNYKTRDKINQLESQIQLLSKEVIENTEKNEQLSRIQPRVIDHIQTLIAEVQSGVDSSSISEPCSESKVSSSGLEEPSLEG